ncbi:hypothetical protein D9Q98_009437 [Chlorella vulgaris]|uniref:Uncharacterized protein n=1 Tax=Chlorella vulgaris TaxID=3077 RepID=A0A9D4YSH3_CHLVU|nr:hypothetical protein D9Q98_009437 [Chlorella vulgaris]
MVAALRRRCLASALSAPAQVVSQLIDCNGVHAPSTATLGLAAAWQQRLWQSGAATGTDLAPRTRSSSIAAQGLLQLSLQCDTQAAGDRHFCHQLTAEERLARIEMLLQQGVFEETVQRMVVSKKGGPYMQSASNGAAILAVLRERGCSDADLNVMLRCQPNILQRAASSISDVFAALDDMLQLSRPQILRVCLKQPSLLSGRHHRLFELSDAEVSKLFPYLALLLELDPEERIRPRWDLCQSLLGEFQPADKRRFMTSPGPLQLPEATIRDVFRGVEHLMGSTAAAQDLLLRSPNLWSTGVERLATNLRALQQLYGCSVQQAQRVLLRESQLAHLKLEAPKFQCRVAVLTEWYGHTSPAVMLLAPSRGSANVEHVEAWCTHGLRPPPTAAAGGA